MWRSSVSLVEQLNQLAHLTPDEIVKKLHSPLAFRVTGRFPDELEGKRVLIRGENPSSYARERYELTGQYFYWARPAGGLCNEPEAYVYTATEAWRYLSGRLDRYEYHLVVVED